MPSQQEVQKASKQKNKKPRINKDKDKDKYSTNMANKPSTEETNFENLEVLDIRAVVALSERMKSNLEELKKENKSEIARAKLEIQQKLDSNASSMHEQIKKEVKKEVEQDLQNTYEQQQKEIAELKGEINRYKQKTSVISDLLQHNYQVIYDLSKRLDNIELSAAKRSAILTGLKLSDKKDARLQQVQDLLQYELGVYVDIEDTYTLGDGTAKPVVITFDTANAKRKVFENKHRLKQLIGHDNKPIFINDYLPAAVNERKRRERDVVRSCKTEKNLPTEMTKKGLKIGKSIYKKKVNPPSPTDILDMTPEELEAVLQIKTTKGPQLQELDSVFIPYSMDVKDHVTIRQAYHKVRLLNARARHVVCAYYLPGEHEKHYNRDYADDGEHGAGRAMLNAMVKACMTNKAFFVVRMCGQEKLGGSRLTSYVQAIKNHIQQHPMNSLLKQHQNFEVKETDEWTTDAANRERDDTENDNRAPPRRVYAVSEPKTSGKKIQQLSNKTPGQKRSYRNAVSGEHESV